MGERRAIGSRIARSGSRVTGLRFCFPTTFYPPYSFGGDAIAVQRLARALVRRGHEVAVIHDLDAFAAASGGARVASPAAADGVEVISLRSRAGRVSPLLAQQTGYPLVHGRALRTIFEKGKFDVVNFHNASLIGGPGVFGLARGSTRVYTAHEHWLICPTHVLWRHRRELCPARECFRCQLINNRPPQLWRHGGRLNRSFDEIDLFIAMSSFSARKHAEFGFPREMSVLPPFCEAPALTDDSPSPHDRPYFFFAGRLEEIKGLQRVIPQMPSIPEADLLVAGQGSCREEFEAMSGPQVRFLGALGSADLDRHYRHAVATITPSITYETFGLTLIESFARGTPVVATRLGPFPEIMERSGGGLLFETDEELVSALKSLVTDPALRSRLGASAREGYEAFWSEDVIVPAYLDLVTSVVPRAR